MNIKELAPDMGQAGDLLDLAAAINFLKACEAILRNIGMHNVCV